MNSKEQTYGSALNAMQRYCAKHETCLFDIKRKLNYYNLSEEDKLKILEELVKEGFINEERYTKIFVRDKFRLNKWGKIKISYQLRTKAIPEKLISSALEEIKDEEYEQVLVDEIVKKINSFNEEFDRGKVIRNLQSKGFELELILQYLKI